MYVTSAKNYENWLTVNEVIAIITRNPRAVASNKPRDVAIK